MKLENRSIAKMVILSIVTCGIYGIVWSVKIARDAVRIKDENDDGTLEIILVLLLPFLGFYLTEKKFTEGCQAKGIPHKDNTILYLVLGLLGLGIVDYCLLQSDLNELADAGYTFGMFQNNCYQQPNYQQPNYQQPNYQQPNYQQPNYQQPNYQQPNYQQPNYQQPNYQQPNYQQSVDNNPDNNQNPEA